MSKDKLLKSINKLDVMGNKEEFKSILTTMVNGTEEKEIKDPSKPAPNEIWYTTADGQICNVPNRNYFINCLGYSEDEVKFEVVSNVYKNGKGVITFKDPVIACGYANDLEYYGLEGDVEEG